MKPGVILLVILVATACRDEARPAGGSGYAESQPAPAGEARAPVERAEGENDEPQGERRAAAAGVRKDVPPAEVGEGHPGTIVFIDADGEKESRDAGDVPASIAWAEIDGERRPVVRIEVAESNGAAEITRYGEDGRVLDRTFEERSPPESSRADAGTFLE